MTRTQFLSSALPLVTTSRGYAANRPPNIVIMYADDLGYGDVSCYGAERVKTQNIDRLAASGIRFTHAHSPSATCTPSRYAMLTGEYAWRKPGTGVLPGDARMIIEPGRYTLPAMLKRAGYQTGVVGKWHLGLGAGNIDWNGDIKPGPKEIGFDYSFLIPATGDRVPCVYTENGRVVGLDPKDPIQVDYTKPIGNEPTGKANPELLKMHYSHGHDMTIVNGISRIGYMTGGKSARWVDEDMADRITEKAVAYINNHKANPFFLYFSTHDIHVPRVPHKRFAGKTGMGPRGDAILSLDWSVGQLLDTLERNRLMENTLVIFSSDNGPVVDDGYKDDAVEKLGSHKPRGPLRGGKYSMYDGGTRVPFVVSWKGKVKPGESNALVSQIDLLSSLAGMTGQKLPEDAAPDSLDVLPALLGQAKQGRDHLVEHAGALSLIQGDWKAIEARKGPKTNLTGNELGNSETPQLFNLADDIGEKNDLAAKHPERVKTMLGEIARIKATPRTRK
jgi:arylsulfatase A-like enzyme